MMERGKQNEIDGHRNRELKILYVQVIFHHEPHEFKFAKILLLLHFIVKIGKSVHNRGQLANKRKKGGGGRKKC
jgi:hypothetical protein